MDLKLRHDTSFRIHRNRISSSSKFFSFKTKIHPEFGFELDYTNSIICLCIWFRS